MLSMIFQTANAFDLSEAWRAALNYSAGHAAAKHSRDAEAEQKYQARAALLPQVTANAVYQKQPYSLSANTQSHGWNVQAGQILFDKSRFAQYRQGRLAEKMADIRLAGHADELRLNVAQAYFDVLLNRDKLAAVRDEKSAYGQQIRQAQAMFAQGAATILDTYEAKAGYDAALAKEIDTATRLQIAENTLADLTGLNPADIRPLQPHKDLGNFLAGSQEQQWQQLAKQHNHLWQLQKAALANAEAALAAAKGSHLPRLTLNGGYQDNHSTRKYAGDAQKYRSKGATLTLQLSMPLYSGGQTASQVREAAARVAQNHALLLDTERQTALAVRQAYLGSRSSKIQMLAQQRLLDSANARLEATRMGKTVGIRNNLEEVQAQQAKADAEQKLAEAKYGHIRAYLQLLQSAGVLNESARVAQINTLLN
ncbi:TolC family protein [Uruburuella testudinis]|uniref:TolC family protein n=1 Tax=Uruburuella testudinis TaxID=1282863 RepID=A0ABY4DWP1_9NEIS|nr:TolC family protein [Uruburuella testudinis]UOO83114.1 TolC family protein [Uruburuella testudinis]